MKKKRIYVNKYFPLITFLFFLCPRLISLLVPDSLFRNEYLHKSFSSVLT